MEQVVKVAKIGEDARSTDPNDFIFHSSYNTFKIIHEDIAFGTIDASSTVTIEYILEENGVVLDFIPLVSAFAKRDGVNQVFAPNGFDVESFTAGSGFEGDVTFNYVSATQTSIFFNFTNVKGTPVDLQVKFFLLEKVT